MGRRSVQWLAAALAMCGALAPSDSSARDTAYAGTWAAKRAQCRLGQDKPDAPLVLNRNGYDQHETHCKFGSVRAQGKDTWRVLAKRSVQGDAQNHAFMLVVAGTRLTIRDEHGARVLWRCR
jgi:hypothetical protein